MSVTNTKKIYYQVASNKLLMLQFQAVSPFLALLMVITTTLICLNTIVEIYCNNIQCKMEPPGNIVTKYFQQREIAAQ